MIVAYETTQIAKSDIISSRKWQSTVLTHKPVGYGVLQRIKQLPPFSSPN